jgi:hypothetical protein
MAISVKREDRGPGWPEQKTKTKTKNNRAKKDWKCNSSTKALT